MRRNARFVFVAILVVAGLYAWLGGFQPQSARTVHLGGRSQLAAVATEPVSGPATGAPPIAPADSDSGYRTAFFQPQAVLPQAPERIAIGRNENFYTALQRAGFDHDTIMDLVAACRRYVDLGRVQRGDTFELTRDPSSGLRSLRADVDAGHYLVAERSDQGFAADLKAYPVERVVKGARGTVRTSLFEALTDKGADPALAISLGEILGWDIDFFRDLRRGDTFEVVYEEYVHDGRQVQDGRLLAAKFVNAGRVLEAYWFPTPDGRAAYYDGTGRSLEKQFLRAPLRFDRISSGYSRARLHPILKYYRPHEGIDYAAPVGTPVRATASGVVAVRERYRGYGNHIVLRHGAGYETWYLHLSAFARGLAVGERVEQGDVIGYVGSTGLSTAPHLCYRIKRNGKFLNPSRMDMPPSEPVDASQQTAFAQLRDRQRALLAGIPDGPGVAILEAARPADLSALSAPAPAAAPRSVTGTSRATSGFAGR